MKFLTIFLLLINCLCNAQKSKKIIIVDSQTIEPIEFCTIRFDNNDGTYSNSSGEFFLDKSSIKRIAISHIAYDDLNVEQLKIGDTLKITRKKIELPQVEISNLILNSSNLKNSENIDEKVINTWHFQAQTEFILFLKPVKNEIGAVLYKVVVPSTIKQRTENSNETTAFRLNIYDENKVLIHSQTKESNLSFIKINQLNFTLDKQIVFPEQGLFFGIEFIGQIDDNNIPVPMKKGNSIALNFTSTRKNNSYYRNIFLNEGNWTLISKSSKLFPFPIESNMNVSILVKLLLK